jgi:AraC family transcriptional activator of pobA
MDKIETIEDFYKRKFGWMTDNIHFEIGHFNEVANFNNFF